MSQPTFATYEVTIIHPRLDGPLVMELKATTEHAAITRARYAAFHMYREATMLHAEATATVLS